MKQATITIPDDLESRIKEYTGRQEDDTSLSDVVQAALEEYLEGKEHLAANGQPVGSPVAMGINPVENKNPLLPKKQQEKQEKLKRFLEIIPLEEKDEAGEPDVSINHDDYLAEETFKDSFNQR